ncbi:MAG: hypothetical protein ACK5QW_01320 [Cyanobacteriota bacterium]
MNLPTLDLRSSKRLPSATTTLPPGQKAPSGSCDPGWGRATGATWPRGAGSGGGPVTPGCRLWLEGWEAQGGPCDILELSPHGVTIAIPEDRRPRGGQHGQLLIGPADGGHYALPVTVRRVKRSPSASIMELVFLDNERWAYRRG